MSSSEIDEPKDPHLCFFCRIPRNPPDGGNPPTMYLEKIQKNPEFENSEFERERGREGEREREKEETNCCQLFKLIRYLYLSHEPSA